MCRMEGTVVGVWVGGVGERERSCVYFTSLRRPPTGPIVRPRAGQSRCVCPKIGT